MDEDVVAAAIKAGKARKMLYTGEPTLTRGDNGENVISGWDVDGYVYVWDSTYGWSLWSSVDTAPFVPAN